MVLQLLFFSNLSVYAQIIKKKTHKHKNCLVLLLTGVPGAMDPVVDPPLGNCDHTSIYFEAGLYLKFLIPHFLIRHI